MVWLAVAAIAGDPAYVQANVLNVREKPDAKAPHVARLRIGTAVEVGATVGPWVSVTVVGRPAEHAVTGWVQAKFLGDVHPSPAGLRAAAAAAASPTQQIVPLERWVALEPGNPEAWRALDRAYEGAQDSAGRERVRRHEGGFNPILLAVCSKPRASLVAEIAAGQLRTLEGAPLAAPEELGALPWMWPATTGYPIALPGTPFVRPWSGPSINEAKRDPYGITPCSKGEALCEDSPGAIWRLGPCNEGGILATGPLHETAIVVAPFPTTGQTEGDWRFTIAGAAWRLHAENVETDDTIRSMVTLHDPSGRGVSTVETGTIGYGKVYSMKVDGEPYSLIALHASGSVSFGELYLWLIGPNDAAQLVTVMLDTAGC